MNRLVAMAGLVALGAAPGTPWTVGRTRPTTVYSDTVALEAVVGVVGDDPITRNDVEIQFENYLQDLLAKKLPIPKREVCKAYLDTIVNLMVDNQVLLAKAKEYKISIPDIVFVGRADDQMKRIRAGFASEAEYEAELLKAGMGTPDDYRRYFLDQLKTDTTIRLVYDSLREAEKITPVNVSESEVESRFKAEMASYTTPPLRPTMVSWRQLIMTPTASAPARAAAKAKAESLLTQIKAGADFEALAKKWSMDPGTKDQGGDLGFVPRGKLVPEFDKVLFGPFALRPGEISPVTETAFGYHIIRMDKGATSTEVHVHHILIAPAIDSADVERTHRLADSLATLLRGANRTPGVNAPVGAPGTPLPVSFDTLTQKYNDFAGGEAGGLMPLFPIDTLPASYRRALKDAIPGEIVVFPIPTASGYSKYVIAQIVKVEQGGPYTLEDKREQIRSMLSQQASIRRLLDGMRKQVYIKLQMNRVYSILDDPKLNIPPSP